MIRYKTCTYILMFKILDIINEVKTHISKLDICKQYLFFQNSIFENGFLCLSTGVGYLLFIAHARITATDCKCRFYGPCAVNSATLNGVPQPPLTEVGRNLARSFISRPYWFFRASAESTCVKAVYWFSDMPLLACNVIKELNDLKARGL